MDYFHKFIQEPISGFSEYLLPFLIVLSVLVFVHEWGHYIVARLCGVKVLKFSIGFGKEIWGWTDKKGTRWKVSWMPLGGYVQMFGDVDPSSATHREGVEKEDGELRPFTEEEKKVAFFNQSLAKKSAIVFAGPAINFLFAIVILAGLFAIKGEPYTPAVVGALVEGHPAAAAGILPDDKIIEAGGRKIDTFEAVARVVSLNLDKPLDFKILRSTGPGEWVSEPVTITVTPKLVEQTDRFGFTHMVGRIGVQSIKEGMEIREHTLPSAIGAAFGETWNITADTFEALSQMVLGIRSPDELGGILRIGAYAGDFAKEGFVALITFAAILSVNLGIINLLPIPLLDGGHLAFYAVEGVKGSPVGERAQEYAFRGGFAFLIGIMVFATWNDLVQLKVIDYVSSLIF